MHRVHVIRIIKARTMVVAPWGKEWCFHNQRQNFKRSKGDEIQGWVDDSHSFAGQRFLVLIEIRAE